MDRGGEAGGNGFVVEERFDVHGAMDLFLDLEIFERKIFRDAIVGDSVGHPLSGVGDFGAFEEVSRVR